MSEINVNQQAEQVAPAAAAPKKKVRIGFVFLSFVPIAALLGIQTLTQSPFLVLSGLEVADNGLPSDYVDYSDQLLEVFNAKYAVYCYLLYAVVGITAFSLWYYFGFVKKNPKVKLKEVFGVKSVLATVGMVIGLQYFITAAFVLAYALVPDVINNYMKLMESSGLVGNPLVTILYAIVLGPILEELCFRGVTFGFLEKSGVKPFLNILITGLLFGIMHMNLVQGIYASVLGFFLGYMRYKYRSLKITVVLHILFNFMGTYGEQLMDKLSLSDGAKLIIGGIAVCVLAFSVVLVHGDPKAYKEPA